MRTTKQNALFTVLVFASAACGCLPTDERPPPGTALFRVSGDDVPAGFMTDDGWLVRYDEALIAIGNVNLFDDCTPYAEGHYVRVVDLLRMGPQKLTLVNALGHCAFLFEVRSPPEDAVLGPGVTEAEKAFLRAPGSDPYVSNRAAVLHLAGAAERAGRTVRFAWSFRENLGYADCGVVNFDAETSALVDVRVRTASLFDASEDPASPSSFEPFAAADADLDGTVTLEELDAVPLPNDPQYPTLGLRLYRKTARELPIVEGGQMPCKVGPFTEE